MDAASALYIVAADPAGDDPANQAAFGSDTFVVVQELALTQTARLADVVLPAQAWTEREGSYTNGERRVQRYYPALSAATTLPLRAESPGTSRSPLLTNRRVLAGPQADFAISAYIAQRLELDLASVGVAAVMARLAKAVPAFAAVDYQKLAQVEEQWPIVGGGDLYYGGTTYENSQGLGLQLPLAPAGAFSWPQAPDFRLPMLGLIAFPVTRLYDQGTTLMPSRLLHQRIGEPHVVLNAADAARLKVADGALVRLVFADQGNEVITPARLDDRLPERVALVPRSFGIPIAGPMPVEVRRAERVKA
jgi:NADH-quinone oxidoreductase subunit G